MKRTVMIAVGMGILLVSGWLLLINYPVAPEHSFFPRELRKIDLDSLVHQEGVISHLVEDFSAYAPYSRLLDPFDGADGVTTSGRIMGLAEDAREGAYALRVLCTSASTTVSGTVEQDLSRWEDGGVVSLWMHVSDWARIKQVDLALLDADGQEFVLHGAPNLDLPRDQNRLKSNDPFPDLYFLGRQPLRTWQDFMLVDGWNFLFWEYGDARGVDMRRIQSYRLDIIGPDATSHTLALDNLRIQDGLIRERNPLHGNWYPPNGLPQYGVFDWIEPGRIRLLNVEQEQYPSNGDHVRILSRDAAPRDFIMRVRLTVVRLAPQPPWWVPRWVAARREEGRLPPRHNTYFRLQWDFDNEYDPGHDWSGIYNTFEYEYLGLRRVFPIERYFVQGSEPAGNVREGRVRFAMREKRPYEYHVKVVDREVEVVVYEIRGDRLKRVAALAHSFRRERPAKRYPISIETTGNIQIEVHHVEVAALD